jgi:hypothetical protein
MENYPVYDGLKVVISDHHCLERVYVNFRRPRSKKARIRRKWRRNPLNRRWETKERMLVVGKYLYVSQRTYKLLLEAGTLTQEKNP